MATIQSPTSRADHHYFKNSSDSTSLRRCLTETQVRNSSETEEISAIQSGILSQNGSANKDLLERNLISDSLSEKPSAQSYNQRLLQDTEKRNNTSTSKKLWCRHVPVIFKLKPNKGKSAPDTTLNAAFSTSVATDTEACRNTPGTRNELTSSVPSKDVIETKEATAKDEGKSKKSGNDTVSDGIRKNKKEARKNTVGNRGCDGMLENCFIGVESSVKNRADMTSLDATDTMTRKNGSIQPVETSKQSISKTGAMMMKALNKIPEINKLNRIFNQESKQNESLLQSNSQNAQYHSIIHSQETLKEESTLESQIEKECEVSETLFKKKEQSVLPRKAFRNYSTAITRQSGEPGTINTDFPFKQKHLTMNHAMKKSRSQINGNDTEIAEDTLRLDTTGSNGRTLALKLATTGKTKNAGEQLGMACKQVISSNKPARNVLNGDSTNESAQHRESSSKLESSSNAASEQCVFKKMLEEAESKDNVEVKHKPSSSMTNDKDTCHAVGEAKVPAQKSTRQALAAAGDSSEPQIALSEGRPSDCTDKKRKQRGFSTNRTTSNTIAKHQHTARDLRQVSCVLQIGFNKVRIVLCIFINTARP